MNLSTILEIYGGGPGSGCTGSNCGRPEETSSVIPIGGTNEKMASRLRKALSMYKDQDALAKLAKTGVKVIVHSPGETEKNFTPGSVTEHGAAHYNKSNNEVHLFTTIGEGATRGEQSWGILKRYLAHELGHALEQAYTNKFYFARPEHALSGYRKVAYLPERNNVGSYGAKTPSEHLAEAFRMHMEEPEKLAKVAPKANAWINEKLQKL